MQLVTAILHPSIASQGCRGCFAFCLKNPITCFRCAASSWASCASDRASAQAFRSAASSPSRFLLPSSAAPSARRRSSPRRPACSASSSAAAAACWLEASRCAVSRSLSDVPDSSSSLACRSTGVYLFRLQLRQLSCGTPTRPRLSAL